MSRREQSLNPNASHWHILRGILSRENAPLQVVRLQPDLPARAIRKRLDRFADWYNSHRPHQALGGRTPDEVWHKRPLPDPVAYRAIGRVEPIITVRRHGHREDPDLPTVDIAVRQRIVPAA